MESREKLAEVIKSMSPWHHDIDLFDDFSTGKIFSPTGRLKKNENDGVSLISPKARFYSQLRALYPNGMQGRTFLDCACNSGGYCFWAREFGCDHATGFDVREHWIQQAKFVQQHRTCAPTDNIDFHVLDLYDLPSLQLEPASFTYFGGIFYHLPDPITGIRIAADHTTDIMLVGTAMVVECDMPYGLVLARESRTKLMSGVHELAWFPTSQYTLMRILQWLGFVDFKITRMTVNPGAKNRPSRGRIEMYAAREKGRLDDLEGELVEEPDGPIYGLAPRTKADDFD